ncbi:MAG: hypothetical protein J2P17_26050, partial [Mycobacterium sp.]|nr:hypothetical protein [Mycobacterium sp.]
MMGKSLSITAAVAVIMCALGGAPAAADEAFPLGVLPAPISCAALTLPGRAGSWPVPMYGPNTGIGLATMPLVPAEVAARLPARIDVRTTTAGFNEVWQYAALDGNLYIKAVHGESGWRIPPMPQCLRGRISGISVDGSRLVATVPGGQVYTMDLADQTPELWWWTARFGSPIWFNPAGNRV